MSSHDSMSVGSPDRGPALVAAVLGIPTLVILVLAVVLNWGR